MKNKTLVIFIIISVLVFGGLVFSVYKMISKDNPVFYSDGYVSVSSSESSEKVYFNKGTTYKKAYNDNIAFETKESEKTEVSKYSFVLYNDKSISFLSGGVLMDLGGLTGEFIPYYNIKSNYLINYNSGKYVIKARDKDIVLDNFIGRITDEKYIVAGNNLRLKLSSSEEYISGYYFELIFSEGDEGNIVKISNDTMDLETISSECYILVGDNIKIDLANKVIFNENEAKVNLGEITIDSDSNIDILYEEFSGGATGDGNGTGDGEGDGTAEPDVPAPEAPTKDPLEDFEYRVETVTDYRKVPYVEIISSNANAHKIELGFRVVDSSNLITGPVSVRIMNLQTMESTTKEYSNYFGEQNFVADNLTSDSSYMVTIYASYVRNNNIYRNYTMFQRTFNTTDIGVAIEKDYVTSSKIGYNVLMDKNATFTSAELNLYNDKGELVESYPFENKGQNISVLFENLTSDTNYTAKIENISYGNVRYGSGAAAVSQQTTLKFNPFKDAFIVSSPLATVNKKDYNITFDLGEINDINNSIKEVVYNVYEKETDEKVKTIKRSDTNSIVVDIDDEIKAHTTYYYKAVITLDDGEKLVDYETLASNDFNLDNKISPTMKFHEKEVTANTIKGYFVIQDPDNALDTTKDIYVEYTPTTGDKIRQTLSFTDCPDEERETTKCANLELIDLKSNEIYTFNLYGFIDLKDEEIEPDYDLIGAIKVNTEKADIILTRMEAIELDETESLEKVFELTLGLALPDGASETLKENISGFDIMLYEGFDTTGTYLSTYHIDAEAAKGLFNEQKVLTLSDFGYSLEQLQKLHIADGKIAKNYSIRLRNGKAGNDYLEFKQDYLNFTINDVLLGLVNTGATINLSPILNNPANVNHDNTLNNDTTIGFKATTEFGNKSYALDLNFTIYDVTNPDNITSKEITQALDLVEGSPAPVTEFYFKDDPDFFKRGRVYEVEYTISLDLNDDGSSDLTYPFSEESISIPAPVRSEEIAIAKQMPTMVLFPWTSDLNSISYKYQVKDIDGALPTGYNVLYEVGEESHPGEAATCHNSENVSGYKSNFNCVKFTNLNNKDVYSVYLNAYLYERTTASATRVDINNFTFESIYSNLNDITYNPEINEDGTSTYTNILSLKISESYDSLTEEEKIASEELKKRISYYTLEVEGPNNTKFVITGINDIQRSTSPYSSNVINYLENGTSKKSWTGLSTIDSNLGKLAYIDSCKDEIGTCLYFDYSKLYNSRTFKTEFSPYKNATLSLKLHAVYDTGKVGYLANSNKNYVFQVKSNEEINKGRIYNDLYLYTVGSKSSQTDFNDKALGTTYAYITSSRFGFADDSSTDNAGLNGKMSFINTAFTNLSISSINLGSNYLDMDYDISSRGVEINFNTLGVRLPLVAKELSETAIGEVKNFNFDKVVPAISVLSKTETVNGIKLNLSISGLNDEDVKDEGGNKYLYLEIFKDSNLLKTIKVNKNNLTSASGIIIGKEFTIPTDDDYKVDIIGVTIDGTAYTNYSYDYRTKVITFAEDLSGKSIKVTYRLVIDDLNVGTAYNFKAYMYMGKKNSKTYLADITSPTYADFIYNFNTKDISNVRITGAGFTVQSMADYKTRQLNTNYTLDDIFGFDDLSYQICNSDNTVCVDTSKNIKENSCYNDYSGTCLMKNGNSYNAKITHDISITDSFDFIYNTNYNLVIKGIVSEEAGVNTYEIYQKSLNVRPLENPTLDVVKTSKHKNDNYYITFDVSFNDPDRVVSIPDGGDKNGYFVAYLTKGPERVKVTGAVDKNGNSLPDEQILSITENDIDITRHLSYGNLQSDSEYYLIIEYKTYRNNEGLDPKIESFGVPHLIYTLDDNNISVGTVDYTALADTTILKFGYATNITQDFIKDESGVLIPNPEQEAYVAGISYNIKRKSGDDLFNISDSYIFADKEIEYITGDNSGGEVGENYYQMTLKNTVYPVVGAYYMINFKFFLGGNVTAHLTTEEECKAAALSNYWDTDKNKCYILGEVSYNKEAMYGGAK